MSRTFVKCRYSRRRDARFWMPWIDSTAAVSMLISRTFSNMNSEVISASSGQFSILIPSRAAISSSPARLVSGCSYTCRLFSPVRDFSRFRSVSDPFSTRISCWFSLSHSMFQLSRSPSCQSDRLHTSYFSKSTTVSPASVSSVTSRSAASGSRSISSRLFRRTCVSHGCHPASGYSIFSSRKRPSSTMDAAISFISGGTLSTPPCAWRTGLRSVTSGRSNSCRLVNRCSGPMVSRKSRFSSQCRLSSRRVWIRIPDMSGII